MPKRTDGVHVRNSRAEVAVHLNPAKPVSFDTQGLQTQAIRERAAAGRDQHLRTGMSPPWAAAQTL